MKILPPALNNQKQNNKASKLLHFHILIDIHLNLANKTHHRTHTPE
jgi:hypothetical protein